MIKGIAAIGALGLLTILCWVVSDPVTPVSLTDEVSQLFGALGLTGFAAMMVLSTRWSLLDSLFNGLDKSYVVHKWLGLVSISLVLVHMFIRLFGLPLAASMVGSRVGPGHWGVPSVLLFVGLGLLALLFKRLTYETWKYLHMFMALAYVVGLAHYYGASSFGALGLAPFSLWLDLMTILGVGSAVYSLFLYERIGFGFHYRVTGLRPIGQGNLEITAAPTGRPVDFRAGQFVFVKIPSRGFPSHPLTISAPPQADTIQLAVGALGDHTSRLADVIELGDELRLSRAHGTFDYRRGHPDQIWIAAGIGITPFRSFLLAGVPQSYSVDFFYSYRGDQAAYLDELAPLGDNVRLHLIDTSQESRLTVAKIVEAVSVTGPVDVYFCGPKPMRRALFGGLKASRLQVARIHDEEYSFGR